MAYASVAVASEHSKCTPASDANLNSGLALFVIAGGSAVMVADGAAISITMFRAPDGGLGWPAASVAMMLTVCSPSLCAPVVMRWPTSLAPLHCATSSTGSVTVVSAGAVS
ncbi:MAG TPA: hypothetical protein VFO07_09945 [Roseiflexaceae bacterium]|nr:hypothetical protein [Roseiflexaceae bacterium]